MADLMEEIKEAINEKYKRDNYIPAWMITCTKEQLPAEWNRVVVDWIREQLHDWKHNNY